MASFLLPTSIQKRLLRYALSKIEILEILDSDALDLKNLDITWGTKNVVEFRDTPLRLRVLKKTLNLPPGFEIVQSQISLLRITMPVDFYSSPIVVELDGVEAKLRVIGDPEKRRKSSAGNEKEKSGRRTTVDDENAPGIPTANDLAASFLETEPAKEKEELEAAILSRSQALPSAETEDDEDEYELGTGSGIGLPAFMANFLKAVLDRLEVRIRNVVLHVDLEVPNEHGITDPVSIQLKVDDVDIEGITYEKKDVPEAHLPSDHRFTPTEGKRLISLRKIGVALVSEAIVFTSLAKSSSLSSPSTIHSDYLKSRSSSQYTTSFTRLGRQASGISDTSTGIRPLADQRNTNDSSAQDEAPLASSLAVSEGGRFDDAFDEEQPDDLSAALDKFSSNPRPNTLHDSQPSYSSARSAHLSQSRRFEPKVAKDLEENDSDSENELAFGSQIQEGEQAPNTPRSSSGDPFQYRTDSQTSLHRQSFMRSVPLPTRTRAHISSDERLDQPDSPVSISNACSKKNIPVTAQNNQISEPMAIHRDSSSKNSPPQEDLAQSMLFSHEEAQSMYLSAMSETPDRTKTSSRMPGGWNDESTESIPFVPAPESPRAVQPPTPIPLPKSVDSLPETSGVRTNSALDNTHAETVASETQDSSTGPRRRPPVEPTFGGPLRSMPKDSSNVSRTSRASSDEYSRVSKCILRLDEVAVYLPPVAKSKVSVDNHTEQSRTMPPAGDSGNFTNNYRSSGISDSTRPCQYLKGARRPDPKSDFKEQAIDICLGSLEAYFDVSVGRLLARMCLLLSNGYGQTDKPSIIPSQEETKSSLSSLRLRFRGETVSVKFLEHLAGTLIDSQVNTFQKPWDASPDLDVLLQTSIAGLEVDVIQSDSTVKSSVTLEKFLFGYARENIISFDLGLRMYESVRDLASSKSHDLAVEILKTPEIMRVSMNTLPVSVAIDLQRLDETFSWFGGLSGVMNMGSSVASNATLTAKTPTKPYTKPRGVHFDTPIRPNDTSVVAQSKVDARIGGFVLQLVGQECSVSLETSAVKIVSREEGIGMAIDTIRLTGPHIHRLTEEPAVKSEFSGIRVEFLTTPKDTDLDRLLSLITPSNAKYDQDDDILVDTLLRQRRKGSVLRLTIDKVKTHVSQLDDLRYLPELGRELSRLSTVAKYLPEDDRPGLLSLVLIRNVDADVEVNEKFGKLQLKAQDIEVAQITLPSLIAFSITTVAIGRNGNEELIGTAPGSTVQEPKMGSRAIMARMIGDEMEPAIKVRLWNLKIEYSIPTLVAILGLSADANGEQVSAELASSIVTLTDGVRSVAQSSIPLRTVRSRDEPRSASTGSLDFDVVIHDCVIGLNPFGLSSKILVVLTESRISVALPKSQHLKITADLKKASLLVIDDISNISSSNVGRSKRRSYDGGSTQVSDLCDMGFVSVSYISAARAVVQITSDSEGEDKYVDVELRDELLVLETCADSTQTLIAALGALGPPTPPSTAMKYRTKVMPMEDLLASLSGDAFAPANNETYDFDEDFGQELDKELEESVTIEDENDDDNLGLDYESQYSHQDFESDYGADLYVDRNPTVRLSPDLASRDTYDGVLLESINNREQIFTSGEPLSFDEDHFETGSLYDDSALRWSSAKNEYIRPTKPKGTKMKRNPVRVRVRDVHVIWNLFDGYDWQGTRDKITKKVQEVETRAIEKRSRHDRPPVFEQEIEDEETVIGDMLFNSIYIGIPSNRDPRELAMAINQDINNGASETESVATTTLTSVSQKPSISPRIKGRKLRLNRSRHHKITFELSGVNADVVVFPPGLGETLNSIDIRVHDLDVFDHVPTSTWRKFATYMHDAGERETGANMIHIELLNVRPDPDLTASEMVIRVTVLPLRLFVDQDALDFITRFFEFKDEDALKPGSPSEEPFLQRVEINDVRVRLNYKPKRVDYAGIRSGHVNEFKNFVILDEADMVLKHAIIFGISGFDKLGVTLNTIWTNDVKRNQLGGILGAIGPVKSLVNVGSGVRDLVVIPMREYKKDGRIVRSLRKGVVAFAKTTGMEVIKAGTKMAIGTQTALQGAEEFLNQRPSPPASVRSSEEGDEEEEAGRRTMISPYAAQPIGVMQGMRGGIRSLKRDLFMARDAIIAVPGEVMESGSAGAAAKAVFRRAPTVIIRPLIGVTGAIGQGLMGVNNSLDPENRRRTEDRYKSG